MQKTTNSPILIFTRQKSSRFSYITDVIFGHMLGLSFSITTNVAEYRQYDGIRINYSGQQGPGPEIWIPPAELLFQDQIRVFEPECRDHEGLAASFFHDQAGSDLPFDLFAFCFYLLSRYEEYTATATAFDRHGRYKAEASLAYRHRFLQQPLIDKWAERLVELIQKVYPGFTVRKKHFQFLSTFDIDLAWAYRERPWWRHLTGLARDLIKGPRQALLHRRSVWTGRQKDPFDTYEYLITLHQQYGFEPVFFFLLGDYGRYDRNISPANPRLQHLIKGLGEKYRIGIHPSYRSHEDPGILQKEIDRLRVIYGREVRSSRFHFLKFQLPVAYRRLIRAGIRNDFSMGYADHPGFRAGIAGSFPWYDLEKEKTTKLMIHPFQVMDGSLKNYLNISPEQSIDLIFELIDATARVSGTFSTLWHNSSFSYIEGWKKWTPVFEAMLARVHTQMPANHS